MTNFIRSFLAVLVLYPAGSLGEATVVSEQLKHDAWLEPAESQTTIYDADPKHLWNRLHEALWVRRDRAGRALGRHRIDPLLWVETVHILDGPAHRQAVGVLEEFQDQEGEKLIRDPVKRAVLQRDLWAIFDWLVSNPALLFAGRNQFPAISPEREFEDAEATARYLKLRGLLAHAIRSSALTDDDLRRLSSNYQTAVTSGAFPRQFNDNRPDEPFLPADLFDPKGTWLMLTQNFFSLPLTPEHYRRIPRSEFLVFVRLPTGRQSTIDYVNRLNEYKTQVDLYVGRAALGHLPAFGDDAPRIPAGTQVALVRRMLLPGADGKVHTTPLVESVQIRVLRSVSIDDNSQTFVDFSLDRKALFQQDSGGLRPSIVDETDIKESLNPHPEDPLEYRFADPRPIEQRAFRTLNFCHACHDRDVGVNSILSLRYTNPQPTNASFEMNASSARFLTEQRFSLKLLNE